MESTPETINKYESRESKVELMKTTMEYYKQFVSPELKNYKSIIKTGASAEEKREAYVELTSKIFSLQEKLTGILMEHRELIPTIGRFNAKLGQVLSLLKEAPDLEHTADALEEKMGGKKNIQAGTMSFEHTERALDEIEAMAIGIEMAIELIG